MQFDRLHQTVQGGKYEVAVAIVDKTAAREYLEACVEEAVHAGIARDKAETIERTNILEFARRYPKTVQYRVQTLFGCVSG